MIPADTPGEHILQWVVGNLQGMTGIAVFAILFIDAVLLSRAEATEPTEAAPITEPTESAQPAQAPEPSR